MRMLTLWALGGNTTHEYKMGNTCSKILKLISRLLVVAEGTVQKLQPRKLHLARPLDKNHETILSFVGQDLVPLKPQSLPEYLPEIVGKFCPYLENSKTN